MLLSAWDNTFANSLRLGDSGMTHSEELTLTSDAGAWFSVLSKEEREKHAFRDGDGGGAGGHRHVKKCQCLGCWGAPRPSSCVLRVRPNPPPVSPRLFFFLPQPIHLPQHHHMTKTQSLSCTLNISFHFIF